MYIDFIELQKPEEIVFFVTSASIGFFKFASISKRHNYVNIQCLLCSLIIYFYYCFDIYIICLKNCDNLHNSVSSEF